MEDLLLFFLSKIVVHTSVSQRFTFTLLNYTNTKGTNSIFFLSIN